MESFSRTSRSPSPTLEAPPITPLNRTTPSLSTAAAPPHDAACNHNDTDAFGVSEVQGRRQMSRETVSIKDKAVRKTMSENIKVDIGVLTDDGYTWRKYGQKMILQSKYPRSYYRCKHRTKGCLARKHVQMISQDPPRHKIVYTDSHTCENPIPPHRESDSSFADSIPDSTIESATTYRAMSPLVSSSMSSVFDSTWDASTITMPGDEIPVPCPFEYMWDDLSKDFEPMDGSGTVEERHDAYSMFFLFPEDYEFEEDNLIQLWMARECITDEQEGHRIFTFLFDGGYTIHSGIDHVTKSNRYKVNTEKMKILLDLQHHNRNSDLKWENGFQSSDLTNPSQVQHASLVTDHIDAKVFQKLEQLNELKTLLFLQNYGSKVLQIPDILLQSLKKLQALDLSGTHIKKLSSSVGCLILLRYLDLSRTLIEWLPDTICSLVELQTLRLRGCSKLRGLPSQLKRLTNLRHLEVDVLRQLTTVPRGIGSLVNLQTLSGFLVGDEDGCKIQELKELNSITGDFCIAMLENVGNTQEAEGAALFMKHNLNKLQLRWTDWNSNCYEVLECLQPWSGLKELQIFRYGGAAFPIWVGGSTLSELVSVTLFECEHVTELPLLEQLPWLKHLELVKMNGIKKIERRGDPEVEAFSRLEKLEIDGMQSLETWRWVNTNENDYRNLVELTINDCPQLRELFLLSCLTSIKRLEIKECLKLETISETKLPDSLEDLIVEDCPMIRHKSLQQGGEDWYTIQHVSNISICASDLEDDDEEVQGR